MRILEVVALAIVVAFVVVRARLGSEPRSFLARLAVLCVASWAAEDSCIRLYGFYHYHPGWSLFIDRVPLAIVLIWPIVIHSAWELARYLLPERHGAIVLAGGAMVLADASMIEPIAVRAGLWTWTEPGIFDVPPIGIIGWSYYAGLAMLVLEHNHRAGRARIADVAVIALAPLGTHALLLASWWGLFRWINQPLEAWPFVAAAWLVSIALSTRSFLVEARTRVPLRDMLNRVPAAVFFFALLGLHGSDAPALIAYALAFAPPYLSLCRLPLPRRAVA